MRAHTITTKPRAGRRGRTKRTIAPRSILALSLAVVLLAAAAGTASAERGRAATLIANGVTTSTPAPPLTLGVYHSAYNDLLTKRFAFTAITSNDSTLVARGSIKKTTKQLEAGELTEIKARIKHAKRLNEQPKPGVIDPVMVRLKVAVTDAFGQTAADQIKVRVLRNPKFPECPPISRGVSAECTNWTSAAPPTT